METETKIMLGDMVCRAQLIFRKKVQVYCMYIYTICQFQYDFDRCCVSTQRHNLISHANSIKQYAIIKP